MALKNLNAAQTILLNIPATQYINDTSREYALYVAENRGIPCVWDGLKDGQRKALYVLQKRAGEIKTISLAGEMISRNIYVHGDAAAAESIGKLAAPYQNNLPLIKGIGNFGTRTSPGEIAAARYTYVKKNNVTDSIMYPDSDIAPMMDNYDGSAQSPKHYLPLIPTVLLNGIDGMAPGFSTYILPRSVGDIIQATLDVLDIKVPTTLAPKYDYTGGDVVNTGPNKWAFYGAVDVVDDQTVIVRELCPGTNHEKFIANLDKLEDDKSIRDYHDQTKDIIDITIRFNRGQLKGMSEHQILELLGLCKNVTERIVVVDWDCKTINTYDTPEELVIHFVSKRFDFYIDRYKKMLAETQFELQFWDLLKACYDSDLPGKLKGMKNKSELVSAITAISDQGATNASEEQIDRVSGLPSYRWAKDEYEKIIAKIDELNSDILHYNDMLADQNKIWAVYRNEVAALQNIKFDIER